MQQNIAAQVMRLGQLARKLALSPGEIVTFLAGHQIQINEGGNTKLMDDHVRLIVQQYAPERLQEMIQEPDMEEKTVAPLQEAEPIQELVSVNNEATDIVVETTNEIHKEELPQEEQVIEVIKAPKVSLSGLKVIGKIDLPEPKKKELQAESTENSQHESEPKKYERGKPKIKNNRKQHPTKNPVAWKREREQAEAEKRRQAQQEREKEKRTLHYLRKVKTAPPTKPAKLYSEPLIEMSEEELKVQPKTWWGKFIKWLRRS